MHVPGVQNKVVDCLSRYYNNDRFNEIHEYHKYVSSDIRLDPNHEDLTELRLLELTGDSSQGQLFARRLRDQNEDRIVKAEQMASAAKAVDTAEEPDARDDALNLTMGKALQNGPSL
jgi:hypothetical protein